VTAQTEEEAYRRFLRRYNLDIYPRRNPYLGWLRRLAELDELETKAAAQIEAATDRPSKRRAEAKLDRYERERLRLFEQMDAYTDDPDVVMAMYEDVFHNPSPPRTFTAPSSRITEED
jgi:hypothetical protein